MAYDYNHRKLLSIASITSSIVASPLGLLLIHNLDTAVATTLGAETSIILVCRSYSYLL